MYVIYINDRPIYLLGKGEPQPGEHADETHLTARYTGKRKSLLNYADTLEKASQKVTSIALISPDVEQLWEDFRSHYKWVEAAGGVVRFGKTDRYLFIYRRGYWDLPKGKLDKGEDAATAAVREVQEETGLRQVELGDALPTTYHTYRTKKQRILKPTYWFAMCSEQEGLEPEEGEGIELAHWRRYKDVLAEEAPMYESLQWLLAQSV